MLSFRALLPSLGMLAILVHIVLAQAPVEFDVASIRPHAANGEPGSESSDTNVLPGGRLSARNVTVRKLIRMAFLVDDSRILGAPGWIDSESYDIEAKTADGVPVTRENIQQLVESLLVHRFELTYHREIREMPEYALETAKDGLRIKPDDEDSKPSMSTNSGPGIVTFRATKLSMKDFAGSLARQTGRPVVDKTGIAGEFDFNLTWSPDEALDNGKPSIFTALQPLGLRLVSTKGPVEFIVIDRVEKASEN